MKRSEYKESFEDKVNKLVAEAISESTGEGVIVTKWVIIGEVTDGREPSLVTAASSNMTSWDFTGMLTLAARSTELEYAAASFLAADSDEDNDEDDS